MPEITLTTFIEFVSRPAIRKPAILRAERHRQAVEPPIDYYKEIREALTEAHGAGAECIARAIERAIDPHQQHHFEEVARGCLKWRPPESSTPFRPPPCRWTHGDLIVRIDPELGYVIDGVPHVIKLYYRAPKLPKARLELMIYLMRQACAAGPLPVHGAPVMAVLDTRRAKLLTAEPTTPALGTLLRAEAEYFSRLWPEIGTDIPLKRALPRQATEV